MSQQTNHKLRLPVRVVDGVIEFEYGGQIPVRDNARAELILEHDDIDDPAFLDRMARRRFVKLFAEGAKLYVVMPANGPIAIPTEKPKLGKWFDMRRFPIVPGFLPITLGPLLPWQKAPDGGTGGGLWLEIQGNRSIRLISSRIALPINTPADPVRSLNHAYTVLSEKFEPHRISHTGNVYEQVLYQEKNGLWYPLKLFRDSEIAGQEHEVAKEFWADLKAQLMPRKEKT